MTGFEQQLLESPSLPRLPAQARLLLELLSSGEPGAALEVLEQDPELGARVLVLVDATPMGSGGTESLAEAQQRVGANTLACTALAVCLVNGLRELFGRTELLDSLWRSALMTGLAARALTLEVSSWEPGEALLAGIVEKVGAVLLYDQLPEYPRLAARHLSGEADLIELERASFASDHGSVSSCVLEHWGMPAGVLEALRAHFAIDRPRAREPAITHGRILTGAALFGRALAIDGFVHEVATLEQRVADLVRIPRALAARIATELPRQLRRVGPLLSIPCEHQLSYAELLLAAEGLLTDDEIEPSAEPIPIGQPHRHANRASGREFEDLLRKGESALPTDPETGRFDPIGFESMLSAFYDRARELHRPLSVLVIGIRGLRGIIERLGPNVADELVETVAERVAALVRHSDPKGHPSGTYLGIIAAGCSERDLPRLAERIRWAITREPLATRSGPVQCEVAIGMASATPGSSTEDPKRLMSCAWSALDEAALCGGPIAIGA